MNLLFFRFLLLVLFLAAIPAAMAQPEPFDRAKVMADLARIDARITGGMEEGQSPLAGKPIKVRDIYLGYIEQAAGITEDLLKVKREIELHGNEVSLQRLGALSQQVALKNRRVKESFSHGEEMFQTWQLIETATRNLDDALSYWRLMNRYRAPYRGSADEQRQDDEILQVKLQTAVNAIDELNAIIQTRDALKKALEDRY